MEFWLLGPLEVAENGRPISLGGSRARALLALLLLNRNQVVPVDRILDELWGGRPPKTGGQVVRVYVSHLRKALEPSQVGGQPRVLLTRRNGYLLRVAPNEVDVDRFEELRAEGRRLLGAGEIADAAITLKNALSVWRGAPLQDFAYEAFAQPEIARLEELRLGTLEDLFDAQLAAGRDSELVADLEQLVDANPLRERLREQLMLALYRAGRPADALKTYQRGRRLLVDELGLEPGEALRRLEQRILQQDRELDRPTVAPESTEPADPRSRMRSRNRAARGLAVLLLGGAAIAALLATATAGHGKKAPAVNSLRVALVVGAPRNLTDTSPSGIAPITGLLAAGQKLGLQTKVLYGGYSLTGFLRELRTASLTCDLVIVGVTPNLDAVSKLTRHFPKTRFLVTEAAFGARSPFAGQQNVTGVRFDNYENGYLGGYLAGLVTHGDQKVSAVVGVRSQELRALIAGFAAGARRARPRIQVLVAYTGSFLSQAPCERAANSQIERGSAVIFDAAGPCGFGALQAAEIRGVWGLSTGSDVSNPDPHMLGTVIERADGAIERAVTLFAFGQLPGGQDLRLDLASGDIGLFGISPKVRPTLTAKVEAIDRQLRSHDQMRQSG